jgi:hypothetical protein
MSETVTNKFNLPAPVMDMIGKNDYTQGPTDVNVTSFIAPPQVTSLKRKHRKDIVVDASDLFYAAWGNTIHTVLEGYGERNPDAIVEEFLHTKDLGVKWGGHIDLREPSPEGHIISDYKQTGAFKVKKAIEGFDDSDWECQLNCYAQLVRRNHPDIKIAGIQVVAWVRDWSKIKAAGNPTYPQAGVVTVPLPLWSEERAVEYIHERLSLWQDQEQRMDFGDPSIPCTDEERWKKPDEWRVVFAASGKTKRVFDNEEMAKELVASEKGGTEKFDITFTPGLPTRCTYFCEAAPYCAQYKGEQL